MPDFAPNYTARYKLRYSTQGAAHTMQFRFPRTTVAADAADMVSFVSNFLTQLEALMWTDWTVMSASFAQADNDIFLPIAAPTTIAGTLNGSSNPVSQRALSLSFVGRSAAGLRAAIYVYGLAFQPVNTAGALDFRLYGSENANIAAAATALADVGPPQLVGNDNQVVSWYPYANVKYNDYWVRRVRS